MERVNEDLQYKLYDLRFKYLLAKMSGEGTSVLEKQIKEVRKEIAKEEANNKNNNVTKKGK